MHMDVVELEHFYASHLGQMVQRRLRLKLRELWPNVTGRAVLGLGYGNPLLRPLSREATRILSAMPAKQGANWWRAEGRGNATLLIHEDILPLPDLSVDRVVALHYLENTENLGAALEEIWRVLTPEGRFIAIVPNRAGLWARVEETPFANGRPFSRGQFDRLLGQHRFTRDRQTQALHFPPVRTRLLLNVASGWERISSQLNAGLGGVHIIEAVKRVRGVTPLKGSRVHVRLPRRQTTTQPALVPSAGSR